MCIWDCRQNHSKPLAFQVWGLQVWAKENKTEPQISGKKSKPTHQNSSLFVISKCMGLRKPLGYVWKHFLLWPAEGGRGNKNLQWDWVCKRQPWALESHRLKMPGCRAQERTMKTSLFTRRKIGKKESLTEGFDTSLSKFGFWVWEKLGLKC